MDYRIISKRGEYALIERGTEAKEYAVVKGLNDETGEWDLTCNYWIYSYKGAPFSPYDKAGALSKAIEHFNLLTTHNYITRSRLEELATKLKDGLIESDEDFAANYFNEECEMTDKEKLWFGIIEDKT